MAPSRLGDIMNKVAIAFAVSAALFAVTTAAWPFGTVRGVGQNAEHERITRHALGCGLFTDEDNCFQDQSLQELARAPTAISAPLESRTGDL